MANRLHLATDEDKLELQRMRRKLGNILGPNVSNTPEGVSIGPTPQGGSSLDDGRRKQPRKYGIVGAASSISDNRWSYVITPAKHDSDGAYTAISGASTVTAYNSIEAGNTATGIQGCGINADNLPTGWEIKPIGSGAVVEYWPVVNCDDDSTQYIFQAVNNADGTCP